MKIVFMGTPEFAIPALDVICKAGYEVVSVVTAPDRPSGRGLKLKPSPVKKYALEHDIPVLQPEKLRNSEFISQLKELKPDLMVVVAFRMLPEMVWSIPTKGTFNLHAALLPDYRGAAPINWTIINGESRTGVTTFFIDHKIDTGQLLLQEEVEVPEDWTAGDLHDKLMEVGAGVILKTIKGIENGSLKAYPQDDSKFQHKAPKIHKADCKIHWDQPTDIVYNFIRGLSPYPTAWTTLNDQVMKVFFASRTDYDGFSETSRPGTLRLDEEAQTLDVATQDGWLRIESLQLAGKKRMDTAIFLNGYKETLNIFL